jgi:hypothetical protein
MSTHSPAADLAQRLAQNVEAVCRTYLSNGRRAGGYWVVGDAENHPGSSLFVRLQGPDSGKGAAGKWSDAATGDHGDLLDLIARNRHLDRLRDVLDEARSFLSLPRPVPDPTLAQRRVSVPQGSCESARRLFAASRPLAGTLAERYLQGRSLTDVAALPALRFHPRCFYRPEEGAKNLSFPALVAAVTDLCGTVTGVHRTWLDPAGAGKAAVETPRRAMGHLLGHAVRFGVTDDVLAAGEGIETVLSLRSILPNLPLAAALSSNHLAAILFPPGLRVLYILRDRDPAGDMAVESLSARATAAGIMAVALMPKEGDFNDDLCRLGLPSLAARLLPQLAPGHLARFAVETA